MSVNLYDVLNVQQNCTKQDIKKSYRKLLKEFHPDQPTGNTEMFELIVHAYNVLINDKTRQSYDQLFKLSSQSESDHFKFRDNSKNYIETQKMNVLNKPEKETAKEFEEISKSMDTKHKFNKLDQKEISSKDAIKRFNDMKLAREQEDIENINEKIFEGDPESINISQFNDAWDKMHKSHMELIEHTDTPFAWNEVVESVNYGSADNYEDLYNDNNYEGSCEYGSINFNVQKKATLTKDDVKKLEGAPYTSNHNKTNDVYSKTLDTKLRERELETEKYTNKDFKDFITDDVCGGYGIFSKIGSKTTASSITWDNDDVSKKYKSLLEYRNKK
jgi:curved DNA-binding protein CbpA